ncbi:hypothetical protein L3X38_032088 [Prunus dulcis]|uniref:Rapid ALkalinization Factor n=1 Tax=Prunus dulcis TaxID=3755 RepID=A0AAD4YVL0_PRUDU|nr:hypothetical protein L3X38_032088 [Prunus dulcis]
MAMSKTFTLCIVALLVCSICSETTNAKDIGYGTMRRDQPFGCRGQRCMPPPSNSYNRGCEKEKECRAPNNELTNGGGGGGRGMVEEQASMRPLSNVVLAVKKSPSKDSISQNGENALSCASI